MKRLIVFALAALLAGCSTSNCVTFAGKTYCSNNSGVSPCNWVSGQLVCK